ncbi:MAG: lysine--tRNA ligase [Euryarchaeota archaeon]|nr:lysine--tRNA ligase [Euryarchaeota archaeon]|tara:strand:- start:22374 stop:23990 length:1617 start_codon:yes stop_codon:yes gene_type:complete
MHWADVTAQALSHKGNKHIVSTGITPSGEFHIGHLREILTGDMIARAAHNAGLDVEFVFIVDTADPLRKVYDFLGPEYEQFIGHQLGSIPAPNDEGNPDWKRFEQEGWTYGDSFLEPFLEALKQIGVRPRIINNLESYRSGRFAQLSKIACDRADDIRECIERISGRELPTDWFPWSPLDSKGSLDGVKVTGYEYPLVHWVDSHGVNGSSDLRKGEGKLPWRIDWPAKWGWIGVTCEPFGKDHGAAGGSYSTGREIVQILGHEPPHPLTYEWISLKGKGAMSSSAGNTVGPIEALQLVPPEILRLLVAKSKPNKAIEFDTGMGLVTLADEFERMAARDFDAELENPELSRRQRVQIEDAAGAMKMAAVEAGTKAQATAVTFRHLALLAQTKSTDDDVWASLVQSGALEAVTPQLHDRLKRMRHWIQSDHFPEEMKVNICTEPDTGALRQLDELEQSILVHLSQLLQHCKWNADDIGRCIPQAAKDLDQSPKLAYKAAYAALMGAEKGPRLAPILAEMKKDTILTLLSDCTTFIQNDTE